MKWNNSAPSNIALIKYMGKVDHIQNIPSNASLSYSLKDLRTYVEIEPTLDDDRWEPLKIKGYQEVQLSEKGRNRFLQHFLNLKTYFGVKENFVVRSVNNFASDCGLASSASSFAALTKTAVDCFEDMNYKNRTDYSIPQMSRMGSGSSCRSFSEEWCIWKGVEVGSLDLPYKNLIHKLVQVDSEKKEVSSGQAHKRIETSLLNKNRKERADRRLDLLLAALKNQDWSQCFEIVWAEFWDMHAIFHTSKPAFTYMNGQSIEVLNAIQKIWQKRGDGPLVTMDAGPNIHMLFREDQVEEIKVWKLEFKELNIEF